LHAALQKSRRKHEVEYFWRLGQAAAACWAGSEIDWPDEPPTTIQLRLTNFHLAAAARALVSAQINGPYLVVCPMAVGSAHGQSKRWPYFERLCQELSSQGHTIVICPGPGEEVDAEAFRRHACILPGTSIGAYSAIIAGDDRQRFRPHAHRRGSRHASARHFRQKRPGANASLGRPIRG
jgi:heptosyltransferase-2